MLPRCLGIHLSLRFLVTPPQCFRTWLSRYLWCRGPICWGRNPWKYPIIWVHTDLQQPEFKKLVTQATQLTARSPAIPAVGICMAAMLAARTSELLGILGKWCCLFKDRGLVWISIDFPIILRGLKRMGLAAKVVQLPGLKILPEYLGRS